MACQCRIAIIAVLICLFAVSGATQGAGQAAAQEAAPETAPETAPDSFQIGTGFTDAQVDSLLADYPEYVRDAYKQTGLVWQGPRRYLTFKEIASYCAPILWFSPDEPLLHGTSGPDIRQPMAFPFEAQPDSPVGYYRIRTVIEDLRGPDDNSLTDTDLERRDTMVDLKNVSGIDVDFFFFYPFEIGFGAHQYDVESVEMKLVVASAPKYPELGYWIVVQKVIGKAHGILWYDNTLKVDRYAHFPMHILVEEGKHASCTDKNGDGQYSPGYDVNVRVNDAWGVRDVMRSGSLYTAAFQAWMAKNRTPQFMVFPPLPEDSHLREPYTIDGIYAPFNAVYEVRPFPRLEPAMAYDPHLERFVDKGYPDWPQIVTDSDLHKFGRWIEEESFIKSLSISYRYDGLSGVSFVFPLLIVKNVEDPVGGGWIMNRVYLKDYQLRDVSWNLLYTSSASRWIDGYFAAGVEWDSDGTSTTTHFMTETGIKLRFNIGASPLKFLSTLTDFWGIRMGIKNFGFAPWTQIGYAIEIGAGSF